MLFTKKGNIKKEIGTDIKKNLKFLTSVKKLTVNNKQNSLVLTYLLSNRFRGLTTILAGLCYFMT